MDDRPDISWLAQSNSEKAAAYNRLRTEVNTAPIESDDFSVRQRSMERRLEAVKELDECVAAIRQLPGHERFLLGPTLDDLKTHAAEGIIVAVNVTYIRANAIIIRSSAVESIRLPIKGVKKNRRYLEFLQWLWKSCVEAILLEIHKDSLRPDQDNLPRIWWIGAGLAAYLPFHAAGVHSINSTDNTLSWAISSYSPTIKALAHARQMGTTAVRKQNHPPKLLVVTMSETPGEQDLPGVECEKVAIETAAESSLDIQVLDQPEAATVRENLADCDMFHFAGHGVSDHTDPSNSSLLLRKGHGEAAAVDTISVRDVSDLHLKGARIAYLSACSTAEIRATELVDEVIHLASGFQVAGFSHVIASMWETDDAACEMMARRFYEQLKDEVGKEMNHRTVAAATHQSVIKMRSKWMRKPLLWAPYVHFGA